ncbi:ERVV2 protein, partial [Pomatorhinus ruficollis]|nr:ERVV2 protein [Pomatorhinus ruficollis]
TRFHSFGVLLPNLGIAQLEKAISNISAKIELIANSTADALVRLQNEINSLKEVVFQNHMVLDVRTAQMGGVCILINTGCCTYIDQSGQIAMAIH